MPSVSRNQQRLMHGIASGSIPSGKGRPTKAVARDFVAADHARGSKKLPQNVGKSITQGRSLKEM